MSTGERRVCLLTGAGGTLGAAFCRAHAGDYDIVAVTRRRAPDVPSQDESYVDPLAPDEPVPENAARVYTVRADLTRPGEIGRVVDIALARFGRIDLLVNNAAYSRWHGGGLLDTESVLADFDAHFATNVRVPLELASCVAQRFWLPRDRGNREHNRNVVNVSSLAATRVYPGGQAVYAASKAALNQLTRHQAAEFGHFGVRVNALAPNSFPGIVPVDDAVAGIVRLDGESVTGRVLALDAGPA